MKHNSNTITVLDIGNDSLKALTGIKHYEHEQVTFSELHGVKTKIFGYLKSGIIKKLELQSSIQKCLSNLQDYSTNSLENITIHTLFSHPKLEFKRKNIVTLIKDKEIMINKKWAESKEKQIKEHIESLTPAKSLTYLKIISINIDGEDVLLEEGDSFEAYNSIRISFIYILVPYNFYETLQEALEQTVENFTLKPSITAYTHKLDEDQLYDGILICDIGHTLTNVSLYKNGNLYDAAVIPFGGSTIIDIISKTLHLSIKEAENIFKNIANSEPTILKKEIYSIEKKVKSKVKEIFVNEIFTKAINEAPHGILLIGGGSAYINMEQIIKGATGIYTEYFYPNEVIQTHQVAPMHIWTLPHSYLQNCVYPETLAEGYSKEKINIFSKGFNAITNWF